MYLDILKKMKQNLKIMKLKEKWEGKCHNRIPLYYLTSKVDQGAPQIGGGTAGLGAASCMLSCSVISNSL